MLQSRYRPHLIAVGGLLLLVVVLFAPFLFDGSKMLYGSDIVAGLDSRVAYNDAIREHGQFPNWFTLRLSGMPTTDALFADALYPPTRMLQPRFAVHRALGYKMFVHVLLAGVFFYLLLVHGYGVPVLVGFAGGAFYMLNPQFISLIYSGHEGKVFVTAWLPFVVWRLKALMEQRTLWNTTWLAFGVGMSLLTGHVQLTYFVLWGLFLFWVFEMALEWRSSRAWPALVRPGLVFWVAVAAGLGLAFTQLFPSAMFVRQGF